MCKDVLSKKMYDYLAWHSNEIAKKQELLYKELYAEETQESMAFEEFFKEYLAYINNYLSTVSIGTAVKTSCPFVIIGSVVDVHDSDEKEDYQYRIVLPYKNQQDTTIDCASCLSPLGKSLLFKRAKENARIQIPSGELHYIIKKIAITDTPEISSDKFSGILDAAASAGRNINI